MLKYFFAALAASALIILGVFYVRPAFLVESAPATNVSQKIKMPNTIQPKEPEIISPIAVDYIKSLKFTGSKPVIEEQLANGSNYNRYIASYQSDGNKIYGLLTVPLSEMPKNGFPAVIFVHGYIPPNQYVTTQKYEAYVDYLARNGLVVFKIDLRGHGNSEGIPTGTYFSNAYTIDVMNALKSLQKYEKVNPEKIGAWGHSMAGNLILRSMLVSEELKAGVIWAGAVYSYEDFAKYRISDNSYSPRPREEREEAEERNLREDSEEIQKLRSDEEIDFTNEFWSAISLTQNINYLQNPIQLHHAVNDNVVNIGYTRDLKEVLEENNKEYEVYEYAGGGHNINSPYFEQAMQRTTDFFKTNL